MSYKVYLILGVMTFTLNSILLVESISMTLILYPEVRRGREEERGWG